MSKNEEINEMDAAEMLAAHREEHPAEADQEQGLGLDDVFHAVSMMLADLAKQEGWAALGLGLVSVLVVAACCAAVLYGIWKPIVMGIAAAHLLMAGAWWQKAKSLLL